VAALPPLQVSERIRGVSTIRVFSILGCYTASSRLVPDPRFRISPHVQRSLSSPPHALTGTVVSPPGMFVVSPSGIFAGARPRTAIFTLNGGVAEAAIATGTTVWRATAAQRPAAALLLLPTHTNRQLPAAAVHPPRCRTPPCHDASLTAMAAAAAAAPPSTAHRSPPTPASGHQRVPLVANACCPARLPAETARHRR